MVFKIALDAGHYSKTSGKRCLKKLDPNETREWVLNARIADIIEMRLQAYTGYELLRLDDPTGKKEISTDKRAKAANDWGADDLYSIHHNAGIKGGNGGGIAVYVEKNADANTVALQKALYNKLIEKTGLKGNRSNPTPKSNVSKVLTRSNMTAVLMELGFMDSTTDTPIILTEEYADQCAAAIVEVMVERGNLQKKAEAQKKMYRVQTGVFSTKSKAEAQVADLKKAGFEAIIKED